jgi:hypothetical protein
MMQEIGGSQISESNVPPPPVEVKVRTLRSDVEGLVKMGGGLPQFKTVSVEVAKPSNSGGLGHRFPWWVIVVAIVALGVLSWFGYVLVVGQK